MGVSRNDALVVRVNVRVTSGAREDAVLGWQGDVLRIRVRARAQGGQANEAVRRLLAEKLRLPASAVVIAHGASSRHKLVNVDGLNDADLRKRFAEQA